MRLDAARNQGAFKNIFDILKEESVEEFIRLKIYYARHKIKATDNVLLVFNTFRISCSGVYFTSEFRSEPNSLCFHLVWLREVQ